MSEEDVALAPGIRCEAEIWALKPPKTWAGPRIFSTHQCRRYAVGTMTLRSGDVVYACRQHMAHRPVLWMNGALERSTSATPSIGSTASATAEDLR